MGPTTHRGATVTARKSTGGPAPRRSAGVKFGPARTATTSEEEEEGEEESQQEEEEDEDEGEAEEREVYEGESEEEGEDEAGGAGTTAAPRSRRWAAPPCARSSRSLWDHRRTLYGNTDEIRT